MTIKSYQANKIDTFSDNYKKLFKQFVDIYTEMKRVPEPGSLIQVTREWEYPFAILNSMPKVGDVCLDLGGGASPLPLYLARKGCNITVIDIDSYDNNHSYNDNKLWGYHPQFTETNLSYIKSDFLVYDFGNKKYDKIYCIGVIEHLKEEEQIKTKELMNKLLKKDGIAILTYDVPKQNNNFTDRLNYHCDVIGQIISHKG